MAHPTAERTLPVALTVAGSDPVGGAGLQLDLKVFGALGCDGAAVPAVLTVQGKLGLQRVLPLDLGLITEQMRAVFDSLPVAAVKTGALGTASTVRAVSKVLEDHPEVPVICDPVAAATRRAHTGGWLLEERAVPELVRKLIPRATLITPNVPEAVALTGRKIDDWEGMIAAAQALIDDGARAVLLKGGHLQEESECSDLLLRPGSDPMWFRRKRLAYGTDVHGTGCALSSAVAANVARGMDLANACLRARASLHAWLIAAEDGRLRPRP